MNQQLIDGLRQAADWFEKNPDIVKPYEGGVTIYLFPKDEAEFSAFARCFGGAKKNATDNWFNLTKSFGMIDVQLTIERKLICEKIITQRVLPAEPEMVIPSKTIPAKPERVQEFIEWDCPKSILGLPKEELAEA